jgi:hypothetical protein
MKSNIELVDVKELENHLKDAGYTTTHIIRNLRTAGCNLHRIRRATGRPGHAVTKEDAEKFLSRYQQTGAEDNKPVSVESLYRVEEQIRKQREDEGWISFRLSSAGMPDLINLKPRGDGSFEILFEEVKGLGDSLKKEQHTRIEDLKQKGIRAIITWL